MTRSVLVAAALGGLLICAPAQAQPADGHGYVYGGVVFPYADGATGSEYRTYIEAPGGWSTGWWLGGGAFLTSFLSAAGELRRSGMMETVEPSRYFFIYQLRRRDTTLSGGARFHVGGGRAVSLEPVASVDVVWEESWWRPERSPQSPGPPEPPARYTTFVDRRSVGLTGGLDVRVGAGRVSLLSGFRARRLFRGEQALSTWPGGPSEWGAEAGAALRLGF